MDIIDVEKAVEERRVWLQDNLEIAAGKLGVKPAGRVVNIYDMRSVGARALDEYGADVWLRVVFEDFDYQPACRWEGNVEANAIQGVPKPRVLRWTDWRNEGDYKPGCRLRGEVMTIAPGTTIASDSDRLSLRFAACDLCVDHAGAWWLIEANPAGQWSWDHPLRDAIASAIADAFTQETAIS